MNLNQNHLYGEYLFQRREENTINKSDNTDKLTNN